MLKVENRLKDARILSALFSKGKVIKCPLFLCKYFTKEDGVPRFAVAVSKKVSKKAVSRNRIIRRIRDVLRLNIQKCPKVDAVIFGSGNAEECEYKNLEAEVLRLFDKVGK